MTFALRYLIGALAVPLADAVLPGFYCTSFEMGLLAGAVLMLLYTVLRPVLRLILGAFNMLLVGLINVVIDAGLIYLLTYLFPTLVQIKSFIWAAAAALIVNLARSLIPSKRKRRGKK